MDEAPLLDEIVLIDSNSTDRTREIAAGAGRAGLHSSGDPAGVRRAFAAKARRCGKACWSRSGDIVAWIDTDIVNIHPRFVYGILGPLLREPRMQVCRRASIGGRCRWATNCRPPAAGA